MIISRVLLWIIWGALLLGALCFALVEVLILQQPARLTPPPPNVSLLFMLNIFGGGIIIAIAHVARFFLLRSSFCQKSPMGLLIFYYMGKLLCWFVCDGVLFFSLVLILLTHSFQPYIWWAGTVWVLLFADAPWFIPFRKFALPTVAANP